jgi:hypothetical protein
MFAAETFEMYCSNRAILIAEDRSLRRDISRQSVLTAQERTADKLVRDIRAAEAALIWTAKPDSILHPFPGMEFLLGGYNPQLEAGPLLTSVEPRKEYYC